MMVMEDENFDGNDRIDDDCGEEMMIMKVTDDCVLGAARKYVRVDPWVFTGALVFVAKNGADFDE